MRDVWSMMMLIRAFKFIRKWQRSRRVGNCKENLGDNEKRRMDIFSGNIAAVGNNKKVTPCVSSKLKVINRHPTDLNVAKMPSNNRIKKQRESGRTKQNRPLLTSLSRNSSTIQKVRDSSQSLIPSHSRQISISDFSWPEICSVLSSIEHPASSFKDQWKDWSMPRCSVKSRPYQAWKILGC